MKRLRSSFTLSLSLRMKTGQQTLSGYVRRCQSVSDNPRQRQRHSICSDRLSASVSAVITETVSGAQSTESDCLLFHRLRVCRYRLTVSASAVRQSLNPYDAATVCLSAAVETKNIVNPTILRQKAHRQSIQRRSSLRLLSLLCCFDHIEKQAVLIVSCRFPKPGKLCS